MIDLVGRALAAQCDALVVCGREEAGFDCIADFPEPGLGPLGGLNAALRYAAQNGFEAVLSAGCDVPNLPENLAQTLAGEGASIVQTQPIVGLWPAALSTELDSYLKEGGRALYGFADRVGARQIPFDPPLMNVNQPSDLGS